MQIRPVTQLFALTLAVAVSLATLTGCGLAMHMPRHVTVPAAAEFGLGPRTSALGAWVATISVDAPLRTGKLQTVRLAVRDTAGAPVRGARIAVDGGMPQHGHGLPTRPQVTQEGPDGTYLIEGMKFSMTGWWEIKLAIDGPAGADRVTFNTVVAEPGASR